MVGDGDASNGDDDGDDDDVRDRVVLPSRSGGDRQ